MNPETNILDNSYFLLLKSKAKEENELKDLINTFISTNLTDEGYFLLDSAFNKEFINFLIKVVDLYPDITQRKEIKSLILERPFVFENNNKERIWFYDFYFKLGLNISCLITTDLLYETISKIIFSVFIFGTTVETFEDYYNLFISDFKLNDEQKEKVKIISDYIKNKNETFKDFGLTSTSYKLLSLGHLTKKKILGKEFLIDNLDFLYAKVAIELSNENNMFDLFESIKNGLISVSTPIFYNSCKKNKMFSSCFIINTDDTISSIADSFNKLMNIQKYNSGVGLIYNNIRASNESAFEGLALTKGVKHYVEMTASCSENFKNLVRHRSSNVNINIGIEHPDVLTFLKLKNSTNRVSNDNLNNIFQTVIIPDEFMYRLINNMPWYLISPHYSIKGVRLNDVYGEAYSKLYNEMIKDEKINKIEVNPSKVLSIIHNAMIQTGGPFIVFKDVVNETSNHKSYGIINGTNLCTEIFEFSNNEETSVCNLSSLNLKKFVTNKSFDYVKFEKQIRLVVNVLNSSIDKTTYSHESCKKSNLSKRPIGIGIQGLAELFNELEIPYLEGQELFMNITEFMYFIALDESNKLVINGKYDSFDKDKSSPIMKNQFVFESFRNYQLEKQKKLFSFQKDNFAKEIALNTKTLIPEKEWSKLSESIKTYGITNSLVLAFMPTSLSSGIYNNTESFEPSTHNIIRRQFSNYDCIVYNIKLVNYLLNNKLYTNKNVITSLMNSGNDLNNLKIPDNHKEYLLKQFKTIYDFDQMEYIKFNASVNQFIDQGKSTNLYAKDNNEKIIAKSIIYHWLQGSKSTYYYRIDVQNKAINFNSETLSSLSNKENSKLICSLENKDSCLECSA